MAIKFLNVPVEALESLRESVEEMPHGFAGQDRILREILAHPDHHMPHPVYVAGLQDIVSDEGLRHAERVAWRYVADEKGYGNYAIEVQEEAGWDGRHHTEIDQSPFFDAVSRVLADGTIAQKISGEEMDLSVLRINAMGVSAIWLRAAEARKDLIIPLQPAPEFLTPGQSYSLDEFQEILKPRATKRLKRGRTHDA